MSTKEFELKVLGHMHVWVLAVRSDQAGVILYLLSDLDVRRKVARAIFLVPSITNSSSL